MIYRQILPLLQQHQTDQLLVLPFHLVDHTWDSKDKKKNKIMACQMAAKKTRYSFKINLYIKITNLSEK